MAVQGKHADLTKGVSLQFTILRYRSARVFPLNYESLITPGRSDSHHSPTLTPTKMGHWPSLLRRTRRATSYLSASN